MRSYDVGNQAELARIRGVEAHPPARVVAETAGDDGRTEELLLLKEGGCGLEGEGLGARGAHPVRTHAATEWGRCT